MMRTLTLSLLVALCAADCYMHKPKGSNNRLNEASANRNNANRCFDSQNNNRGGYNVGELGTEENFNNVDDYFNTFSEGYGQGFWTSADGTGAESRVETGTGQADTANTPTKDRKQTESFYYEESFMAVTWTVQHGCNNPKVKCEIIAQYMVENVENEPTRRRNGQNNARNIETSTSAQLRPGDTLSAAQVQRFNLMRKLGLRVMLQNGANTGTPGATGSSDMGTIQNTYNNNIDQRRCQHESNEWYSICSNRDRNKGLFTADQKVNQDRATRTRQNPNGNRRGLECAEERDYYPYWYATPFVDAAILSDDVDYCKNNLATQSQNVVEKFQCTQGDDTTYAVPTNGAIYDAFTQAECTKANGVWKGFKWNMDAPVCLKAPRSQVNHLGNMITDDVTGTNAGGSQAYFMWKLPKYSDLVNKAKVFGLGYTMTLNKARNLDGTVFTPTQQNPAPTRNCVRMLFRLRYNISTTDYDPVKTNASQNDNPGQRIISPIKQNPTVEMGVLNQGMRLAINTAQTGRTFQDRSHSFLLCQRPRNIAMNEILNVQVQGKRGNIVQTFPATEYQFSPRQWTLGRVGSNGKPAGFHFQWTGSNTHNNGNPAGDGQAGDAGEGRGGSDRNNMCQMLDMQYSYPMAIDKAGANGPEGVQNFFQYLDCYQGATMDKYPTPRDAAIAACTSGYYHGQDYARAMFKQLQSQNNNDQNGKFNNRLQQLFNNAAASYRGGILCLAKNTLPVPSRSNPAPYFAFLCTRNNNFTNRAQKMKVYTTASVNWAQKATTSPNPFGSRDTKMMLG